MCFGYTKLKLTVSVTACPWGFPTLPIHTQVPIYYQPGFPLGSKWEGGLQGSRNIFLTAQHVRKPQPEIHLAMRHISVCFTEKASQVNSTKILLQHFYTLVCQQNNGILSIKTSICGNIKTRLTNLSSSSVFSQTASCV